MSQPSLSKRMRVIINDGVSDYILGVVELVDMEIFRQGGVESKYGKVGTKTPNRHAVGMKRARFTVRRWYHTDSGKEDLLYDLHDNDTEFTLSEFVNNKTGFVGIKILNCIIYSYKTLTGGANDIVGEEIIGEGLVWNMVYVYPNPVEFDEPLDWGYFKNKGEIWFNQESGSYIGYPIYMPDPFAEQGGSYLNRIYEFPSFYKLYEYYNADDDLNASIYGLGQAAQTFTVGAIGHYITAVKLKLYRIGSPQTVTISIKATDGNGHPYGNDLISKEINGNELPESATWIEINFPSNIWLNANTKYAIVVKAPQGVSQQQVQWRIDNTNPTYSGGNREYSSDGGSSWTSDTNSDCMFEVWGLD
jgi:hypothetical protein